MRIGIAFEGCAGRAAFHVGVVEWMLANGIVPVATAGASSGSIVAAVTAAGHGEHLAEIWMRACGQPVSDWRRLLRGHWPYKMTHIVGGALRDFLGSMRLNECEIPVGIPVTTLGLRGRTRRLLTERDDLEVARAVLASCFTPGPYSRMVPIAGRLTLDGAWQVRTPIDALQRHDLDVEVACVTNDSGELILGYPRAGAMRPPPGCRVLAPIEPIPVGSYDLDLALMERTLQIGRDSAARFFAAL